MAIPQGISDLDIASENMTTMHGSTVATNAILEGKGVRTAYIITKVWRMWPASVGRRVKSYIT